MRELELALRALQAANLATPAIVSIIQAVKGGVDSGQTDEQILEHASQVAQETKTLTEADMSDRP
jgi:hypothetical protein